MKNVARIQKHKLEKLIEVDSATNESCEFSEVGPTQKPEISVQNV